MDFEMPASIEALAEEARAVGEIVARERPLREDSWVIGFDRGFSLELGRRGWLGMTWPVSEGGHGRTPLERFVVTEALITAGAPIAASWVGDRQIGPTLLAFGSVDQRRRYIPDMVAGRTSWCLGLSEPDSGSDLASLRTRAVRRGDSYVVEGRKIWTSFGALADHCYLVARTNAEAPPHAGLSELVVDMQSPGVVARPIVDATRAAHFCEVEFDGVHVPAENLVGTVDGSWRQVTRQLEHERGGIDRLVSNRALFLDVLEHVDTSDALVRQEVAALEGAFRVGRLLVLRETLGQAPRHFSAATKVFCTELEQRVAGFCARVLGPGSLVWGPVARAACYAPAYSIMGGTSSILRNVVAERLLGLPRA